MRVETSTKMRALIEMRLRNYTALFYEYFSFQLANLYFRCVSLFRYLRKRDIYFMLFFISFEIHVFVLNVVWNILFVFYVLVEIENILEIGFIFGYR